MERDASHEDATIVEADATIVEAGRTVVEAAPATVNKDTGPASLASFRGHTIREELPAAGSEADIFLIDIDKTTHVLKLYRRGLNPGSGILDKAKALCETFPKHIIRIVECGYDDATGKWFEIQEYARFGSLRTFLNKVPDAQLLKNIIEEIAEALHILHEHNILHLDVKPSNILVRSIDPLDLVFTDFGISSAIDPEMTKKLTVVKGTPLYWAPESFTGVVGKEADWWSMGLIAIELLCGRHPFSGIDTKVIMYTLSTTGVDIPGQLQPEYTLLLRGLLTRNPKQRWGYNEVNRWLKGERDIAESYGGGRVKDDALSFPFVFGEKKVYSLAELTECFIETEEAWEEAITHLMRGYISKWLIRNNIHGTAVRVEKIVEHTEHDRDLSLLTFIYTFNKTLPFAIFGILLTPDNLYAAAGSALKEKATKGQQQLVDNLISGRLYEYYNEYLRLTGKPRDMLYSIVETFTKTFASNTGLINKIERIELLTILDAILNPDDYILPREIRDDINTRISHLCANYHQILTRKDFTRIAGTYVLPAELKKGVLQNNVKNHLKAVRILKNLLIDEELLTTEDIRTLTQDCILPAGIAEHLTGSVLKDYVYAARAIKEFRADNIIIQKKDFEYWCEKYIIPGSITKSLQDANPDDYKNAASTLRRFVDNGVLFSCNDLLRYAANEPAVLAHASNGSTDLLRPFTRRQRTDLANDCLRRLLSTSCPLSRYATVSRYIKNNVSGSWFVSINALEREFAATLAYIEPNKIFQQSDKFSEYNILNRFLEYTKGLKEALAKWEPIDIEILEHLKENSSGLLRGIERTVEKNTSTNMVLGLFTELVRGTLEDHSFGRVCFNVYITYQSRIDEVVNQKRMAYTEGGIHV